MNLTIGRNIKKETLQEKYGPLRKIVREFSEPRHVAMLGTVYDHYEELECGHVMRPRKDIYGVTNAVRRRCWKCKQSGKLTPDAADGALRPPTKEELDALTELKKLKRWA